MKIQRQGKYRIPLAVACFSRNCSLTYTSTPTKTISQNIPAFFALCSACRLYRHAGVLRQATPLFLQSLNFKEYFLPALIIFTEVINAKSTLICLRQGFKLPMQKFSPLAKMHMGTISIIHLILPTDKKTGDFKLYFVGGKVMDIIMKINWKALIVSILIPLGVGALSAFLTSGNMEIYPGLQSPPFAPPGWLFPVVWTILYTLMGISSYLVYTSDAPKEQISIALTLYGVQLAVNFFWSIIFFNLRAYLFAFFWLVLLWVLIILTIVSFWRISKTAGILMLPYLLWVTFAGYLNLAIYLLNS
jgi:tryptophan-rich sensory protein